MKPNLIPLAFVIALLVAGGLIAAFVFGSAGGGGGGSLEDYFSRLDVVENGISDSFTELSGQYPLAFQEREATLSYLDGSAAAMDVGVTGLKAIKPPSVVAAQHQGLSRAAEAVQDAFSDLRAQAEDTQDDAELEALLFDADTTAFDNFSNACLALQDLADQNGILIELNC